MRTLILAVALVLGIALAQHVNASDDVTWTTGGKKGTYIKVGFNAVKMLGGKVVTSKGGEENINRMLKGTHQVGLSQMDTYAYMSDKKPETSMELELMGSLYQEAVYVVVNTKGRIKDEDDLGKAGVTIAVGKKGSGGASTWDYMRQLVPYYQKAQITYSGGMRALGKLAAQPEGDVDAVLFVTKPLVSAKLVQTVMKNENLRFINVNDRRLNNKYKPTGKPVYDWCTVDVSKGFLNDKEVKTICMDAVVIARSDVDEDYLDDLSDKLLNYKSSLLPKKK